MGIHRYGSGSLYCKAANNIKTKQKKRLKIFMLTYYINENGKIQMHAGYALYKVFDANGLIDWATKHDAENIAETMKAEKPWIEESREFFGLVILIVVLLINYFYAKHKMKKAAV